MPAITLNGTELRRADESVTSWLMPGGLVQPARYRGRNLVIPGRPGEFPMTKTKGLRVIDLGQQIRGAGATEAAAQEAYLILAEELRVLYESTVGAPKELRVHAPLYGITDAYWSLNVEWVNNIEREAVGGWRQILTVRFECIDNPPDWVKVP